MIEQLLVLCLLIAVQGKSLTQNSAAKPNIISRSEWGGQQAKGQVDPLQTNPPPYVIIHHSASDTCTNQAICQARVRTFQNYHMNKKHWSDIGYNFLVGEDGNVYEGRGWGKSGAHTVGYNEKSIGICVIGNYINRTPSVAAINAIQNLIAYGVSQEKISSNYKLIGHRQAASTFCPGEKFYDLIQTWPNWANSP